MSSRYSYDIVESEIILFTGAGASCPLGFEALEGLLKLVIDKIREVDRWRHISSTLGLFEKADSLEPVLNLEEFLERLDVLVALKNFEKEHETAWFSAQSDSEEKKSEPGVFFKPQFKSDLEAALKLRETILITIRDHFTKSSDLMEKVVDLYQPLFKLLRKESGPTAIPVFTTNYDLALELFTDRARSYGYSMIDGFDHGVHSTNPPWDSNEYHQFVLSAPGTEPTTLILFKLHGSVFWQKNGKQIVFNRQPTREEIEYVLLYPMQTKTIVEDPFLTCYNYFEECLRNAKLMIAIGHSFGDDYLNQVIARCQSANPELEIMVFNPGFKDNPERREKFDRQIGVSGKNRVHYHYGYFETGEQGRRLLEEVEGAVERQRRTDAIEWRKSGDLFWAGDNLMRAACKLSSGEIHSEDIADILQQSLSHVRELGFNGPPIWSKLAGLAAGAKGTLEQDQIWTKWGAFYKRGFEWLTKEIGDRVSGDQKRRMGSFDFGPKGKMSKYAPYRFEHDFRSGLNDAWTISGESPQVDGECGVLLTPVPSSSDLSKVLLLEELPLFLNGVIECEVYLEEGALFDVMLRGTFVAQPSLKDEFYMARFDGRLGWPDCICIKPEGNEQWHECNDQSRSQHQYTPHGQWLKMHVEAHGQRILLYRGDDLVDQFNAAKATVGRIGLFAELANVYVKTINIEVR
jgi:hypothetical protein